MKSVITFPPIPDAPHWRPTTADEIGACAGEASPPSTFDFLPGWDLAFFTVAQADAARATQVGWVKGHFAVTERPVGPNTHHLTGGLTHLPTGFQVAMFINAEEAGFAADVIADCCDWSEITPDTFRRVGRDVMRRLRDTGFDWVYLASGDGMHQILSRILQTNH